MKSHQMVSVWPRWFCCGHAAIWQETRDQVWNPPAPFFLEFKWPSFSFFFLFGAKPETNLSPSTSLLPVKFCAEEPSQGFLSCLLGVIGRAEICQAVPACHWLFLSSLRGPDTPGGGPVLLLEVACDCREWVGVGDSVSVQVVSSCVLFWCLGIRLQLGSVCIAAYVMMISLLTVTFLSYVCINT